MRIIHNTALAGNLGSGFLGPSFPGIPHLFGAGCVHGPTAVDGWRPGGQRLEDLRPAHRAPYAVRRHSINVWRLLSPNLLQLCGSDADATGRNHNPRKRLN